MSEFDTSVFKTIEEVEQELSQHKDSIYRKSKFLNQVKDNKKQSMAAFNEQIKVIQEEIDSELSAVDLLLIRQREIEAGG